LKLAGRCLLASRGIAEPDAAAYVGALEEVEHRRLVAAFLMGIGEAK
jgi:hypothetical protein